MKMDKMDADFIEQDQFRMDGRLKAPEIYVDGWSQMLMGYPVTKIVFHTTVEPQTKNQKELRRASATITMPLAVAIQLAQTILAGSKSAERQISTAADAAVIDLKRALAVTPPIDLPSGMTSVASDSEVGAAKPKP